jgi:hypothetical protein
MGESRCWRRGFGTACFASPGCSPSWRASITSRRSGSRRGSRQGAAAGGGLSGGGGERAGRGWRAISRRALQRRGASALWRRESWVRFYPRAERLRWPKFLWVDPLPYWYQIPGSVQPATGTNRTPHHEHGGYDC